MIDKRPAAVVRCTGTADIIDAHLHPRGRPTLSTPAATTSGHVPCDDGIVIDVSRMKGVHLDSPTRPFAFNPESSSATSTAKPRAFGRVVLSGFVSQTGLSGLTLGGGFGWLTRSGPHL
jgi:hypothetical protein